MISVDGEEGAREIANDSPYGLTACIWTHSLTRAHSLADRLEYGMVMVNETPNTWPQTSFGGVKQSGHGRQQGEEASEIYTGTKNVQLNLG